MSKVTTGDLIGQRNQRLAKIKKLRELGINPYPARSNKEYSNNEIVENYKDFEGKTVTLTGRIMTKREMGKLAFATIQDASGRIQLYIKKDEIKPLDIKTQTLGFSELKLLDIGDIVEATGEVTKTQTGEISILVDTIKLLTKAIRPLPEKWAGLSDQEERFRRRYLDMTMNPEVRNRFVKRSIFWQAVRDFMIQTGFVEINIPILEAVTGGADAKPFVTHYDALDQAFYLRISHELPLKRLLGGGYEKVFDIGPRFRNEGIDAEHLPEHIAMEFYWAYADFKEGMKFTKELFRYVIKKTFGTLKFKIRGFDVDLSKEWEEKDFGTLLKDRFNVDIYNDSVESLKIVLKKSGGHVEKDMNRSRVVDNLWKVIRKDIAGPIFVTGIPKFLSPLSKSDPERTNIVERFFPIIAGSELANAFSELNDPIDQFERFKEQQDMREAGDSEAQMMDIDFVEMLEYGMPPAFGYGMSERVFWFFEDVTAREGVPFPQMRNDVDETTKKIYGKKYVLAK
ncbi:lysine--tRNA ligase [Candidatus Dojkabacteria bacterium]|nr:lysine--tRNA ligase [Candidatus Dojkabacteria bacterium]